MPQYIQLPDNSYVEIPDGMDVEEARTRILADKRFEKYIPKASVEGTAKDLVASTARGGGALFDMAAGAARFLPDAVGGDAADWLAERAKDARDSADWFQSDRAKAQRATAALRIANAQKEGGELGALTQTAKEYAGNPGRLVDLIVENLPQLGVLGAAAKLQKGVTAAQALSRTLGLGAVMQGSSVSSETYSEALEAAKKRGLTGEEAKDAALLAARIAGAEAGVISLAVNKLLPGASLLEGKLAGVPGAGRLRTAVGEGIGEIAEEVGGKFTSNLAVRDIVDPTQTLTQGFGQTAVESGLAGAGLGALTGSAETKATPPNVGGKSIQQALAEKAKRDAEAAQVPDPTVRVPGELPRETPTVEELRDEFRKVEQAWLAEKDPKVSKQLAAKREQLRGAYVKALVAQQAADERGAEQSAFTNPETDPQQELFEGDILRPVRPDPVAEQTQEEIPGPLPGQMAFDFTPYNEQGQGALFPELPEGGTDWAAAQREARAEGTPEAALSYGKLDNLLREAGIVKGAVHKQLKSIFNVPEASSPLTNFRNKPIKSGEEQYLDLNSYRSLPQLSQVISALEPVAENSSARGAENVRNYLDGLRRVYDTMLLERSLLQADAEALPSTQPLPFGRENNGNQNAVSEPVGNPSGMEPGDSVRRKMAKKPSTKRPVDQGLIDSNADGVRTGEQLPQPSNTPEAGGNSASVGLATDGNANTPAAAESEPTGVGVPSVPAGSAESGSEGVRATVGPRTWLQTKSQFAKDTGAVNVAGGNYLRGRQSKALQTAFAANDAPGISSALQKSKNVIAQAVGRLLGTTPVNFVVDDEVSGEKYDVNKEAAQNVRETAAIVLDAERILDKYGRKYSPEMLREPYQFLQEAVPGAKGEYFGSNFLGVGPFGQYGVTQEQIESKFQKALAEHDQLLADIGGIEPVKRAFNNRAERLGAKGIYDRKTNSVRIPEYFSKDEATVTHEVMHALVHKALDNPTLKQKPVVAELNRLFEYAKTNYAQQEEYDTDHYGFTDIHEFVSEAWSNPEFQVRLNSIPYESKTVWTKFVDAIAKLLGITNNTALTEALALTEQLLKPDSRVTSKKAAAPATATDPDLDPAEKKSLDDEVREHARLKKDYDAAQMPAAKAALYKQMVQRVGFLSDAANNVDDTFTPAARKYAESLLNEMPVSRQLAIWKDQKKSVPTKGRQTTDPAVVGARLERMIQEGAYTPEQLLGFIAERGSSPFYRRTAKALLDAGVVLSKVQIGPAPLGGENWGASYSEDTKAITIHKLGDSEYGLLHEAVHAATVFAINANSSKAKNIIDLYNQYNNLGGTGEYGFENAKEFVAEALANPDFQKTLRSIDGARKKSLWDRLVIAIRSMLGLPIEDTGAFAKLMAALPQVAVENKANSFRSSGTINPTITDARTSKLADDADMVATRNQTSRFWDKLRVVREAYIDRMYQADTADARDFGGRLRVDDITNPAVLRAQLLNLNRLVEQGALTGRLEKGQDGVMRATDLYLGTPGPNASQATKAAHTTLLSLGIPEGTQISTKNLLQFVADRAVASGVDYNRAAKDISTILGLVRIGGLRKMDAGLEQQAQKLEALGKKKEAAEMRSLKKGYENMRSPGIPDKAALDAAIDNAEAILADNKELQIVRGMMNVIRTEAIDQMVETGRLSRDKADAWQEAADYIPFDRIAMSETQDKTDITDIDIDRKTYGSGINTLHSFRKLIGSDAYIGDALDSFAKTVMWMHADAAKNNGVSHSLRVMELLGRAKRVNGQSNSIDADKVIPTYENGQRIFYEVPDKREAVAFEAIDSNIFEELSLLSKAANVVRVGVTALPPFTFKQIAEDIHRAFLLSGVQNPWKLIPRVLVNLPQAAWGNWTGKQTKSMKELASYGVIGGVDYIKHDNIQSVKRLAGVPSDAGMFKRWFDNAIHYAEGLSVASDQAVRMAVYEQSIAEGADPMLAQHRARELINFSRRGSSRMSSFMTTTIPFFNAYVQGTTKFVRAMTGTQMLNDMTVQEARQQFFKRAAVLAGIGFMYALMVVGDDSYEELDDTVRDYNWIIPRAFGEVPLAIPIPRDFGLLFKTIPERVVRMMYHDGAEDVGQIVRELARQGGDIFIGGSYTPAALKPLIESMFNYSMFMDRPLESSEQLKMEPWMRYNQGTSDAAKAVGEATASLPTLLQISPIKFENYVRGALGSTGALTLAVADAIVNPSRADRPVHKMVAAQLTGASAFLKDETGTRWQNQFYQLYNKVTQAEATYKKLEEVDYAESQEFLQDHIGEIMLADSVRSLHSAIASYKDLIEYVNRDVSMSPEQKREYLVAINRERAKLASQVVSLRAAMRKYQ